MYRYTYFKRREPESRPRSVSQLITESQLAVLSDNLEKNGNKLTPWFRLILATSLKKWWDNLDRIHEFDSHDVITRLN